MRFKKLLKKSEYVVLCKVHQIMLLKMHDKDVGDMNEWIIAVVLRSNYELPFRRFGYINTYFADIFALAFATFFKTCKKSSLN